MPTAEDLLPPPVSTRSRLYSLAPIGIGTPDVESLESYTTRLAWLHGVNPGVLMAREITRLVDPTDCETTEYRKVPGRGHTISSVGLAAERWVNALEQLTLRSDLRLLTLQPWRRVLAGHGLARKAKAWCPHCLEEDAVPYDRLAWTLGAVRACARHRVRLSERCPECEAKLPSRGYTAKPGFCSKCSSGLARPKSQAHEDGAPDDALERAVANAAGLGKLLAVGDQGHLVGPERVWKAVPELRRLCKLQRVPLRWGRDKKAAARLAANPSLAESGLAPDDRVPVLASMFLICENAGVSLYDFLITPLDALVVHPKRVADRVRGTGRHRSSADVVVPKLRRFVEERQEPPPPLLTVAKMLGASASTLRCFAPELCRIVVDRHREHILSIARERRQRLRDEVWRVASGLKSAGSPPKEAVVAKLLEQPGAMRDPVARQALRDFIAENGA